MVLLFVIIGLVFIALAIPLIRKNVGPNSLYGLRVAETLENEDVWFEANARSGRDLLWLGIGTIAISCGLFAIPGGEPAHIALLCCGLLLIGVLVYAVRGIRIARSVKRECDETRVRSQGGGRSA